MRDTSGEIRMNSLAMYPVDPSHGRARYGQLAGTYLQQLCGDTKCSLEDLPGAIDDRNGRERVSGESVLAARHDDDVDLYGLNRNKYNSFICLCS